MFSKTIEETIEDGMASFSELLGFLSNLDTFEKEVEDKLRLIKKKLQEKEKKEFLRSILEAGKNLLSDCEANFLQLQAEKKEFLKGFEGVKEAIFAQEKQIKLLFEERKSKNNEYNKYLEIWQKSRLEGDSNLLFRETFANVNSHGYARQAKVDQAQHSSQVLLKLKGRMNDINTELEKLNPTFLNLLKNYSLERFLSSEVGIKISNGTYDVNASANQLWYELDEIEKLEDISMQKYHLFSAVIRNDRAEVTELLANQFSPNARDKFGKKPIYYACTCGHRAMVSLLIDITKLDAMEKEDLIKISSNLQESQIIAAIIKGNISIYDHLWDDRFSTRDNIAKIFEDYYEPVIFVENKKLKWLLAGASEKIKRILTLHWNRHNIEAAKDIFKVMKGTPTKRADDAKLLELMIDYKEDFEKKINPDGSFSRRINFTINKLHKKLNLPALPIDEDSLASSISIPLLSIRNITASRP